MNPDELRSGLATAFPETPPPPDLAERAERTARRIRRRRAGVAAVAAAVAVAVPLSVPALTRPDRALPPAGGGGPADSACAWTRPVLPQQARALTRADAEAWGYRGDPALRSTVEELGRDASAVRDVVPLWAGRVDGTVLAVYAAQTAPGYGEWQVVALPQNGTSAMGRLPTVGPEAAISLLVPSSPGSAATGSPAYAGNVLVALAPPGSAGVTYRGCRSGTAFEVSGAGDVLVRSVGTLDAEGQLAVRTASGGVGYNGPAADMPWPMERASVLMPPVDEIPVPAGAREVFRAEGQGPVARSEGVSAAGASVFVRCRAPEPVEVYVDRRLLGAARCDGSVELVAENVVVDGRPSLGPLDEAPPPVSYRVLIVTEP